MALHHHITPLGIMTVQDGFGAGIHAEDLGTRMRAAVAMAWRLFALKVGGGILTVHKEASMQLQYAYLLQQLTPMMTFAAQEQFHVVVESGIRLRERNREIDVLFIGQSAMARHRIAIEMKCYRTIASSGKNRGATDIFMRDVYDDLELLEHVVEDDHAEEGIALVMTDLKRLVLPQDKTAKCWTYDISHGARVVPKLYDTPIGGGPVAITLQRHYALDWVQAGDFWFLEAQGQAGQ